MSLSKTISEILDNKIYSENGPGYILKNNDKNELGYTIKNNYDVDVEFAFEPISICEYCNHQNKSDNASGDFCDECGEYYLNETMEEIISDCENLRFEILCYEKTKDYHHYNDAEISKIKLGNGLHGIMICAASWEPNTWSSTPHDDFVRKFMVYDNEDSRNDAYDNRRWNLFSDNDIV